MSSQLSGVGAFVGKGWPLARSTVLWWFGLVVLVTAMSLVGCSSDPPAPDDGTLIAISSGELHTCGLRTDGTAVCWGSNLYGQSSPPEGERFKAISSSGVFTCALRQDGTPVCWGVEGADHRLVTENLDYSVLLSPPKGERFTAIDTSPSQACGLRTNGTVVCWGVADFMNWEQPREDGRFNSVSVGRSHVCAIGTDRRVVCWSVHIDYEIIDSPSGMGSVEDLSSSGGHACAILDDATIHCWVPETLTYSSDRGQGDAPESGQFKVVEMGNGYGCALHLNGSPVCWGLSQYELNVMGGGRTFGDAVGQNEPPSGEAFTEISLGRLHACGLREDGTPVCWGIDAHGMEEGQYTVLSGGEGRACGVRPHGIVECWGPWSGPVKDTKVASVAVGDEWGDGVTYGLLEDGSLVRLDFPGHWALPPDPPRSDKFKTVAGGSGHLCGIQENGEAYCWPSDNYEERWQLGEGKLIDVSPGLGRGGHVCGLREDGAAVCRLFIDDPLWDRGQTSPPVGKVFTSLSSGGSHTCGLERTGAVSCWGNSYARYSSPEGEAFVSISSGSDHACALREDGTPVCWGSNWTTATSPPEGERFASISSGSTHTCGLRHDGTVACWGWEDFGQARAPVTEANDGS